MNEDIIAKIEEDRITRVFNVTTKAGTYHIVEYTSSRLYDNVFALTVENFGEKSTEKHIEDAIKAAVLKHIVREVSE